jgi:hypothetical protein
MTREIPKLNGKCRVTPHNAAYFFEMGAAVADGYRPLPTLMDAYGRLWTLKWRKFFTISRGALGQHARPRTQIGSVSAAWRRLPSLRTREVFFESKTAFWTINDP